MCYSSTAPTLVRRHERRITAVARSAAPELDRCLSHDVLCVWRAVTVASVDYDGLIEELGIEHRAKAAMRSPMQAGTAATPAVRCGLRHPNVAMSDIRVSGTPRSVMAARAASSTCCRRSAVLTARAGAPRDRPMMREV